MSEVPRKVGGSNGRREVRESGKGTYHGDGVEVSAMRKNRRKRNRNRYRTDRKTVVWGRFRRSEVVTVKA